ncbi:hypothetical protein BK126_26155 [Paenibacillus sp. FSL H7-0326]|uniref:hypothetical protein n=1 Tax=Paenibacillus sp. FSL H7-0326 TaxID=1921144 RepID=UPI00096F5880|nr:hypothetical protein [Paenibacillus sp. FSL H7-0326]OMC63680.1 hypothetical protein BK126_26155 [Paenibacillus sp. FSL H7-0326]
MLKRRYSLQEVQETGLPWMNEIERVWSSAPYPFAVLLPEERCMQLGVPILSSGREYPSAFRSRGNEFIPLYDRTDVYKLLKNRLFPYELMGSKEGDH